MIDEIKNNFTEILLTEWNGRKIWKRISDGELTAAPAFKGNLYDDAKCRIMYVGHGSTYINIHGTISNKKCLLRSYKSWRHR